MVNLLCCTSRTSLTRWRNVEWTSTKLCAVHRRTQTYVIKILRRLAD